MNFAVQAWANNDRHMVCRPLSLIMVAAASGKLTQPKRKVAIMHVIGIPVSCPPAALPVAVQSIGCHWIYKSHQHAIRRSGMARFLF